MRLFRVQLFPLGSEVFSLLSVTLTGSLLKEHLNVSSSLGRSRPHVPVPSNEIHSGQAFGTGGLSGRHRATPPSEPEPEGLLKDCCPKISSGISARALS